MTMPAAHLSSLILFIALVMGGSIVIGGVTAPGDWYAALNKPPFSPPDWIFAPVWTTLYIIIAIAGWRAWRRNRNSAPMKVWWVQLALNFVWSPVFFLAHRIGIALGVIVLLLAAIVGFIVTVWRLDRAASLLFVPYGAWVAFASLLNAALWLLN